MQTINLPVTLDWENDRISIGSQSFTLEQIKYEDHAIRQVIRECMDDTERSVLRLSYPAWYTELFEMINMSNRNMLKEVKAGFAKRGIFPKSPIK